MASDEAPGDPLSYELAYNEAVRAVGAQDESLTGLRNRAGVILSAGSIVAGFLGPQSPAQGWLAILPAVLYVVGAASAILLLLPIKEWRTTTNASDLISVYVEGTPPATLPEIHRSLALYMQADWRGNEDKLVLRNTALGFAAACVIAETAIWLILIYPGGLK